jgi:1,4-dihydroxy-2-naphthoyl-CoA hydrolase
MPTARVPIREDVFVKLPEGLDPELFARLVETNGGALTTKMGVEYLELSAEHSVATMPVLGNTQVVGILHGGAHVVIAESLGSVSSAIHAGPGRVAMGIEINATHSRSISSGLVIATCDALVLGRTLCTHEIVMRDEEGRRLSTVRMTNILRDR